jgi:hypothetical protein
MAEWTKAAEMQLELHRWLTSERGRHWTMSWARRVCDGEPNKLDIYQRLALTEEHKLMTAESIWVAPEMCQIVQMAREGFQPEPILAPDFITMNGFVYFAEPLYMQDRNGMTVSVGAISWCPYMVEHEGDEDLSGMAIAVYSSGRAEHDHFHATHAAAMGEHGIPELIPLHLTAIEFDHMLDEGELLDENGDYTAADEWWKTIQVALRLMQQRISDRYEERLPRPDRRRAQREGLPLDEVLVIRLRRPTSKQHEGDSHPVEWTHQWMVDGHWRWQPYGDGVKRQIWISPYIKGPDDMPLVIKRRYYKWDR